MTSVQQTLTSAPSMVAYQPATTQYVQQASAPLMSSSSMVAYPQSSGLVTASHFPETTEAVSSVTQPVVGATTATTTSKKVSKKKKISKKKKGGCC